MEDENMLTEWLDIVADQLGRAPVAAQCYLACMLLIAGTLTGWVLYCKSQKTFPAAK
jgi:hypothetical protein